MKLKDVLRINLNSFEQKMIDLKLIPVAINETLKQIVFNSNPNFNYLYSNYSASYDDPLDRVNISLGGSILNVLYGSDLDLIDYNRPTNDVSSSDWIKKQMCSQPENYLLRDYLSQNALNYLVCSKLSDTQLKNLFILISENIDFSMVKQKVNLRKYFNEMFILCKFS